MNVRLFFSLAETARTRQSFPVELAARSTNSLLRIIIYLIVGGAAIYITPAATTAVSDAFVYTPQEQKLYELEVNNNRALADLIEIRKAIENRDRR